MVYKHAISTIVPSRVVKLPTAGGAGAAAQGGFDNDGGNYADDY
jgi:host factor-I protein